MNLDISRVQDRLGNSYHIQHFDEVASTNDLAMQLAREGAPAGTIISADYQTTGRGRRGATWVAPPATGMLCSLLCRPRVTLPPHHLAILSGAGAALGLRALDIPAQIKWPNDLMLGDKKFGGILVETTADAVVIGIGVNCNLPDEAIPADIRDRAGSLHTLLGRSMPREEVLAAVVHGIADALARVEDGGVLKVLLDWNKLNWLSRRKVRVTSPMGMVEGDGLFLDGRKLVFHVFKDCGVVPMPLSSTVEVR